MRPYITNRHLVPTLVRDSELLLLRSCQHFPIALPWQVLTDLRNQVKHHNRFLSILSRAGPISELPKKWAFPPDVLDVDSTSGPIDGRLELDDGL